MSLTTGRSRVGKPAAESVGTGPGHSGLPALSRMTSAWLEAILVKKSAVHRQRVERG